MLFSTVLMLAMSSTPPQQATLVFELMGSPVGLVQLEQSPTAYRYTSTHFFSRDGHRGNRQRTIQYPVPAQGPIPSGLWLWRKPEPGCVDGWEELEQRPLRLCVIAHEGAIVRGLLGEQPFTARYVGSGLEWLEVGDARFVRVDQPGEFSAPDLFVHGFPVHGAIGSLRVDSARTWSRSTLKPWSRDAARELARQVNASFAQKKPSSADLYEERGAEVGSCLAHARRFVRRAQSQGGDARLVYGVLAEGERAYPHVWVEVYLPQERWLELDPTSLEEVTLQTHLALGPAGQAGRTYLDLLYGRIRIVRTGGP